MTITLNISDEVEANLRNEAHARGVELDVLVEDILMERVVTANDEHGDATAPDEIERLVNEIFDAVPVPPGVGKGTFHRKDWYL